MEQAITRQTFEELGPERFDSLTTLVTVADGLVGLSTLVWGLAEVAKSSEIRPEALTIIMRQLNDYADMASESAEAILGQETFSE